MNMSYCRFQNTSLDLQDCWSAWYDELEDKQEQRAKQRMIDLAVSILEAEGYEVESPDEN